MLRADAVRYHHSIYGTYGISVFTVRDATLDELAQQVPLALLDRPRGTFSRRGQPVGVVKPVEIEPY